MEEAKKDLDKLETYELQILGSLHKLTEGKSDGKTDMEGVARKLKATTKSLKYKIQNMDTTMQKTQQEEHAKVKKMEKEMAKIKKEVNSLRQENRKLKDEVRLLKEERETMNTKYEQSQELLGSYIQDSFVEGDDNEDIDVSGNASIDNTDNDKM